MNEQDNKAGIPPAERLSESQVSPASPIPEASKPELSTRGAISRRDVEQIIVHVEGSDSALLAQAQDIYRRVEQVVSELFPTVPSSGFSQDQLNQLHTTLKHDAQLVELGVPINMINFLAWFIGQRVVNRARSVEDVWQEFTSSDSSPSPEAPAPEAPPATPEAPQAPTPEISTTGTLSSADVEKILKELVKADGAVLAQSADIAAKIEQVATGRFPTVPQHELYTKVLYYFSSSELEELVRLLTQSEVLRECGITQQGIEQLALAWGYMAQKKFSNVDEFIAASREESLRAGSITTPSSSDSSPESPEASPPSSKVQWLGTVGQAFAKGWQNTKDFFAQVRGKKPASTEAAPPSSQAPAETPATPPTETSATNETTPKPAKGADSETPENTPSPSRKDLMAGVKRFFATEAGKVKQFFTTRKIRGEARSAQVAALLAKDAPAPQGTEQKATSASSQTVEKSTLSPEARVAHIKALVAKIKAALPEATPETKPLLDRINPIITAVEAQQESNNLPEREYWRLVVVANALGIFITKDGNIFTRDQISEQDPFAVLLTIDKEDVLLRLRQHQDLSPSRKAWLIRALGGVTSVTVNSTIEAMPVQAKIVVASLLGFVLPGMDYIAMRTLATKGGGRFGETMKKCAKWYLDPRGDAWRAGGQHFMQGVIAGQWADIFSGGALSNEVRGMWQHDYVGADVPAGTPNTTGETSGADAVGQEQESAGAPTPESAPKSFIVLPDAMVIDQEEAQELIKLINSKDDLSAQEIKEIVAKILQTADDSSSLREYIQAGNDYYGTSVSSLNIEDLAAKTAEVASSLQIGELSEETRTELLAALEKVQESSQHNGSVVLTELGSTGKVTDGAPQNLPVRLIEKNDNPGLLTALIEQLRESQPVATPTPASLETPSPVATSVASPTNTPMPSPTSVAAAGSTAMPSPTIQPGEIPVGVVQPEAPLPTPPSPVGMSATTGVGASPLAEGVPSPLTSADIPGGRPKLADAIRGLANLFTTASASDSKGVQPIGEVPVGVPPQGEGMFHHDVAEPGSPIRGEVQVGLAPGDDDGLFHPSEAEPGSPALVADASSPAPAEAEAAAPVAPPESPALEVVSSIQVEKSTFESPHVWGRIRGVMNELVGNDWEKWGLVNRDYPESGDNGLIPAGQAIDPIKDLDRALAIYFTEGATNGDIKPETEVLYMSGEVLATHSMQDIREALAQQGLDKIAVLLDDDSVETMVSYVVEALQTDPADRSAGQQVIADLNGHTHFGGNANPLLAEQLATDPGKMEVVFAEVFGGNRSDAEIMTPPSSAPEVPVAVPVSSTEVTASRLPQTNEVAPTSPAAPTLNNTAPTNLVAADPDGPEARPQAPPAAAPTNEASGTTPVTPQAEGTSSEAVAETTATTPDVNKEAENAPQATAPESLSEADKSIYNQLDSVRKQLVFHTPEQVVEALWERVEDGNMGGILDGLTYEDEAKTAVEEYLKQIMGQEEKVSPQALLDFKDEHLAQVARLTDASLAKWAEYTQQKDISMDSDIVVFQGEGGISPLRAYFVELSRGEDGHLGPIQMLGKTITEDNLKRALAGMLDTGQFNLQMNPDDAFAKAHVQYLFTNPADRDLYDIARGAKPKLQ